MCGKVDVITIVVQFYGKGNQSLSHYDKPAKLYLN